MVATGDKVVKRSGLEGPLRRIPSGCRVNILDGLAPMIVDPDSLERALRKNLENIVMKLGLPIDHIGRRLAYVIG
jgi:hypothetical protein